MYKSIRIQRFRCFRDLKLEDLARVNLIAGRNNVGKTTLLEAVFLHSGATNPLLALELSAYRGLDPKYTLPPTGQLPWTHLFHNLDLSETIEVVGTDEHRKTRTLVLSPLDGADVPTNGETLSTPDAGTTQSPVCGLNLESSVEGCRSAYRVVLSDKGPIVDKHPAPPWQTVFVFAGNRPTIKPDVERFSKLHVDRRTKHVIEAMQIVEPRIKGLSMAMHMGSANIVADIDLPSLLPIQVLGGGVSRVFSIATSIADSRGGVVLIDEAESGLHHSTHRRFWKAIIEMAIQLDVQLFVTTHSHEFLVAGRDAAREFMDPVFRLHRLDRVGEEIEAVTYDDEALDAAISADIEVR